MPTTSVYGWPYPEASDPPNGPLQIQQLAQAQEATLQGNLGLGGDLAVPGDLSVSGQVTLSGLSWQNYTPVWSADSGTTSLGDGSLTGRWAQLGPTVQFVIRFEWGSTTSQSESFANWRFSIPAQAEPTVGATFWVAQAWLYDLSSGSRYVANGYIGTDVSTLVPDTVNGVVDDQTPFVWAAGDRLNIQGVYEAA